MASANDSRQAPKDAADQNFDYMFKLLIIGNSSVGKTSFLFRYADDSFTSAFVSTVGIDFKVKTVRSLSLSLSQGKWPSPAMSCRDVRKWACPWPGRAWAHPRASRAVGARTEF